MTSVQERLKLKRVPMDSWSVKEKLALASAVLRSGDQNWMSVSRALRLFGEAGRPTDWFSQKSCALQYGNLLENVDTPKRKKRTDKSGSEHVETPGEAIMRNLTHERISELKHLLQEERAMYLRLKEEVAQIKAGQADDKLLEMCQQIDEEEKQKERDAETHKRWLQERQEKKIELERAWKPPVTPASPHRKKVLRGTGGNRRNSSQSEPSSEADSPMSEPLNIDVVDEATSAETKPMVPTTPTSPLLTSLLKSPSPAPTAQTSILHSAITSGHHRVASSSPTIASLLNSSPGIPSTVSSSLKNLVTSAIGAAATEEVPKPLTTSPAAGAPTLSMLLELPPSLPGKPLPELPVLTSTKASGEVCHPQHQEMRMGREVSSDEPVEVVEVDSARDVNTKPPQECKLIDEDELEVVTQVIEMEEEQEAKLSSEAETKQKPVEEDMKLEDSAPDLAQLVEVPAQNDLDIIIVDSSTLGGQEVVEIVNTPEQVTESKTVTEEVAKIEETPAPDEQAEQVAEIEKKKEEEEEDKCAKEEADEEEVRTTEEDVVEEKTEEEQKKEDEEEEMVTKPEEESCDKLGEATEEDESSEDEKKTEEMVMQSSTGGKTWKEEEFEDKEKPQTDKTCVTPKPCVRAETPSTEDDKTNDAVEPLRGNTSRRRIMTVDSVPNSPVALLTDEDREHRAWKKAIMLVYGRLATHKYASLFLRPITDDQAPGYSSIVHRPIDLLTIKRNIETGVTRTTAEFQRDVMLMFLNSIMYNKSCHFVHKMARVMQNEGMQHIQDFLTTQMLVQVVGEAPLRRETRTTEANKQRDITSGQDDVEAGSSKRKRLEPDRISNKKRKELPCLAY